MESTGPRLSSLASMPRLHYDSGELPDSIAHVQASRELAGRAVYPVTLKLELDQKALEGTELLWVDAVTSCQSKGTASRTATTCVWVGDGMLATVADACLTISLKRLPRPAVPAAALPHSLKHRSSGWCRWLPCQLAEAVEPQPEEQTLPMLAATQAEELLQETILLQEVLLTAHMAKAYDFPLMSSGSARLEVVIGTPQKGPYHLALRHANPGTLFSDHNGDDVFAVLPLPPRNRKSFTGSHPPLPPKHPVPISQAPHLSSLTTAEANAPKPQCGRQQVQGSTPPPQGRWSTYARSKSFSSLRTQSRWSTPAQSTLGSTAATEPEARNTAPTPDGSTISSIPRKTMSKKQLQFAPLDAETAAARPTTRNPDSALLSSRSRSVGFDRATVMGLLHDAGVAHASSQPVSASLFGKEVTVAADEMAALQLVSQGSIQSASRRVSRSREPLDSLDRRRSHNRASTATAKDMQTGTPSLDFQIMLLSGDSKAGVLARCVQEAPGLCISVRDGQGSWKAWAQLAYPADTQDPLQLQDITVSFAATVKADQSNDIASGSFQVVEAGSLPAADAQTMTQPAHCACQANKLAHQWRWHQNMCHASAGTQASTDLPITSKSVSVHVHAGRGGSLVSSQAQHQAHPQKGHQRSSALLEAPPAVLQSGLVQTACIAVRHIDANAVLQSALLGPRKTGSRRESRNYSRQVSTAANDSPAKRSFDSTGWAQARRPSEIDSDAGQKRASDDSSVNGARHRDPCPVALWFTPSSTEQAAAIACLSYALYALTFAAAASAARQ